MVKKSSFHENFMKNAANSPAISASSVPGLPRRHRLHGSLLGVNRRAHGTANRAPRAIIGAAALAVLIGGVYVAARAATSTGSGQTGGTPAGSHVSASSSSAPARPLVRLPVGKIGSYAVAERSFVLVDSSRARVAGIRVLPTLVRYPVIPATARAGGRLARALFPLVVFAPGYLQCQDSYGSLLDAWASAGYVVAAVQFPRTNCHVSQPDEPDLVHQPGDVAFVISQLLQISSQPHRVLSGLVNPASVAVAGHSDGGDTVAAVVANTCCLDRRVKAAVILAGAESPWPLGGSWFAKGTPPILFVQGDADNINPPAASLQMYRADTTGPRFYLDLFGVGHLPPYEGNRPPEPLVARVTTAFLDRYVTGQVPAGATMIQAGNVPGRADLVRGGQSPP
jgi:dienelactone hydrolase